MTRLHDIPCSMGDDAAQLFGAFGVIGFPHLPVNFPAVRIANPFAAAGLFSWFHRAIICLSKSIAPADALPNVPTSSRGGPLKETTASGAA